MWGNGAKPVTFLLCKGLREWPAGALRGFHGEQASAGSAGGHGRDTVPP